MICNYFPEPSFFFFTSEAPQLLYYSHFTSILVSLVIGVLLLMRSRRQPAVQALISLLVIFITWTLGNLVTWTNVDGSFIAFVWSLTILLQSLMSVAAVYFMYAFVHKRAPGTKIKLGLLALVLPVFLFAPTQINLSGFNISECNAFMFEGYLYQWYYVLLSILSMGLVLWIAVKNYYKSQLEHRKELVLMAVGLEFFLVTFFTIVFAAQYLTFIGFFEDSRFELFGLFGMTFFVAMIGYMVVKYQLFNIKLIATQALVVALNILVGAELLFVDPDNLQIPVLIGVTLLGTSIGGYFLIKSVKREIRQREEIEKLAKDLQAANDRLKTLDKMKSEFVSIASHQLRSPITAIRGYVSMLIEGSYGKFPDKAQEVLERIGESSKFMSSSIEDYLNVSRIEAGNMKYEMSDFNLKEQAEKIADELRQVALKKGLVLVFRSDLTGSGMVHADVGKARQVIMNFVDNAIKYTPKGTVTIVAHDDVRQKKMWVTITDTGVGMSQETLGEVFDKFVRAKNANQINVTGTGLGLYVAKKMASGMGGKVWAESEGEGKGSTFHLEFPMLPGKANPV